MNPSWIGIAVPVIVTAAVGMHLANRRVSRAIARQRWFKFFSYLVITALVITSILLHFFIVVGSIIVIAGFAELYRLHGEHLASAWMILSILGAFFLNFAINAPSSFILYIYFQVIVFDAFCQITGQLTGRRALAPGISPAKTIEGFAGGMVACISVAVLLRTGLELRWPSTLLFGVCTSITALCGDLLASFYKRKSGVKDYSNWLPGQGGFLDRFDSLIASGAIYGLLIFLDQSF